MCLSTTFGRLIQLSFKEIKLILTIILGATVAEATPLESAEFYNTAHTLKQGEKVIHPLLPSMFGVSDSMNLKTSFLGWLGGPNISSEIGFSESETSAMSADVIFSSSWDFSSASSVGGQLNYTSGGPLTNRFNASAALLRNSVAGDSSLSIPISLGYDIVSSESTTIQFTGASNIGTFIDGSASGSIGAAWNKGWDSYRIRLGLTAAYLSIDEQTQEVLEEFGVDLPSFLPLPEFQMWWRF